MTRSRTSDAGVTLVEVLVVLVLVGVLTSAVALGVGSGGRGTGLEREGDLLISRLNRMADEVALRGTSAALVWGEDSYAFRVREGDDWVPHPVPALARTHRLPARTEIRVGDAARGSLVVTQDLLLSSGERARLVLGSGGAARQMILFDGITARRSDDAS
ncbi:type II secretion system protein GspH [Sulfitobacter alexandrii]|uniref:Type II secretion system protein GspH n=1 Tax=Sulfitobacter alexandrii TaxID=1917485 RepID=A0A1J0WCH2_9RHOB|nr:prepilin-type N-terminal cleavage/methylation domain-containing protein [Sulfitobacter alexandrii]APE42011.1 type II secretion system protein GspH [Sulfitobacter alexandrii]